MAESFNENLSIEVASVPKNEFTIINQTPVNQNQVTNDSNQSSLFQFTGSYYELIKTPKTYLEHK